MRSKALLLAFAIAACGTPTSATDDTDTTTTPTDTDTVPTTITTTPPAPEGPTVTSLELSSNTMEQDGTVTITAEVTDPDGVTTISGGNVRSMDDVVIATFVRRSPGNFELDLRWTDIQGTVGIEFESSSSVMELSAVFFDQQGLVGRSPFQLTLDCVSDTAYACSGRCVDAATDINHCGGCGNTCDDKNAECMGGSCDSAWSSCIDLASSPHDDCAAFCASIQESCSDTCTSDEYAFNSFVRWTVDDCTGTPDYDFELDRCSDAYAWDDQNGQYPSGQCCCTSGAVFY